MTDVDDFRDWDDYRRDDDYEPDPTDWLEAEAQREHEDEAHGGKPCDCPVPTEEEQAAIWEATAKAHSDGFHNGGPCDCEAPF